MKQKKRVLHLASSDSYSGAENVICTIIENDSKNYDMFYCSKDGPIKEILKDRNINFVPLKKLNVINLKKILKEYNIDIIHAHDFKASTIAALTNFKGKIISHIHCNPDFIKKWNVFSITYSILSKRFSSIIVVSNECLNKTVFYSKIKNKTHVIHNIVDQNRIINLSKKNVNQNSKLNDIVFLGRMIELKQPNMIIEVTKELKKYNNNIKTVMIGTGELLSQCKKLSKEYNLDNNINFLGFQSNPFPNVVNSRIAIMPSQYEGLGLSAIECLILGVPVLNSGAGGLSDIFREHPEFICHTVQEYVNKIKLLENEDIYMQYRNICKEIIQPFIGLNEFIEKINELYRGGNK